MVCSQRKIIFDTQVDPYWPKSQTIHSKLAAKDFETSEFRQDTWNHYLMLGFVSAHIPWNAISDLELCRLYKALHNDLVLPSATTLINICRTEYALSMDATMMQLPSRDEVSFTWEGWTSPNKLAITSVIAYYMDQNWALRELQLAFDGNDRLIFSRSESWFRMIGQGPTY